MQNDATKTAEKVKSISVRLIIVLAIFAVVLLLFLFITKEFVLEKEGNTIDLKVFRLLGKITSPGVTGVMNFFTFFGSTNFLFPAYVILVLFYIVKKNSRRSLNIAAVGLSSIGLLTLLKNIFRRHRPSDPLAAAAHGFSYPSGHSTSAFTFCGILIYILWESAVSKLWKWTGTIALLLFAGLIAISRVYLHVHYASDVLAGFCLSFLWLTICIFVLGKINNSGKIDN